MADVEAIRKYNPQRHEMEQLTAIVYEDLVKGIYKKLILSDDGQRLVGGSLVGDASDFTHLVHLMKTGDALPESPEDLILGARGGEEFQREIKSLKQNNPLNQIRSSIEDAAKDVGTAQKAKTESVQAVPPDHEEYDDLGPPPPPLPGANGCGTYTSPPCARIRSQAS